MAIKLIDVSNDYELPGLEALLYDIYVPELDRTVGRCEFRNEIGEDLWIYGQIGYVIYPPYRGHRFAYHACVEMFKDIKIKKGLQEFIITCNPDNYASKKTILNLGGVYLKTIDIPEGHELHSFSEHQKEIYVISLRE